jgi:hypothetical protein
VKRRGPVSRLLSMATDLAASVRRLAAVRTPSVQTVDNDGRTRVLDPAYPEGAALREAAEAILEAGRAAR